MDNQIDRLKPALADRYVIAHELGSGGMATVYLAEDVKHHRKVAVKVLRPELAAAVGTERFLHEIQVAAQLTHPHILALYDSGEADGFLFYVMPVAEGESLRARIDRERQLSVEEAIRLTQQIASALDYAHRQGVIHRDIKPENVLLHEGEAMVTDFGIALAISQAGGTRLTETGFSLGTPHYMSPEQAAGEQDLDARSDVYALGCVLYEMLAGEPPFTGNTAQSVIAKRITESPPSVSTLRETVPEALNSSLTKALARSPADRFESAAAFAAALAHDESNTTRIAITPARWNRPVAAAALFGMASLAGLGAVYVVMLQLGLPDWVLRAAVGLLVVGLPIILATAFSERQRLAGAHRQPHRWLNWRRALQGGGLAFARLALVAAGFMGMRAMGVGPAATLMTKGVLEARDPILLADFENRTSDPMLAETITGGLRIDLSQSRVVRLVEPGAVTAALERMVVAPDAPLDEALARQVAEREGIKAVLAGEVSSVGSGYMLSARLLSPVDGTLLGAERVTADDDTELIAAMDQLSARLRERIGESLKDVRASPPLDRVTTSSLEALRKFTQAVHFDEKQGDPVRALPLLEDAVALDTTFAMAYRKLGNVVGGIRGADASRTAVRRAFELRDRLPARERHLIEGYYYAPGGFDFDGAKAAAAYRSALALDPDDYVALNNLSSLLTHTRQWAERESLALRAIEVSGIWQAYNNAFEAQLLQGNFAEAQATIDRYAEVNPGQARATHWQARVAIAKREYDLAEQVLREGASNPNLSPTQRGRVTHWLGDLLRLRGRVAEARQWYRDWMAVDYGSRSLFDFHATYHVASLEAEYGSQIEALRLLDSFSLDSVSLSERPYLLVAEFLVRAGQVDRAKALLAEFEERVDAGVRQLPTYQQASRQISGEIALREDRFDDAAAEFTAAYELAGQCMTCGLSRLAYSLEQGGREDSALAVYQRLVAATVQLDGDDARLNTGIWSLRGFPESYRRLGELYEARNDTTKGIDAYNEFVELWKDADPELQPLVEDIRRRIGMLTRER